MNVSPLYMRELSFLLSPAHRPQNCAHLLLRPFFSFDVFSPSCGPHVQQFGRTPNFPFPIFGAAHCPRLSAPALDLSTPFISALRGLARPCLMDLSLEFFSTFALLLRTFSYQEPFPTFSTIPASAPPLEGLPLSFCQILIRLVLIKLCSDR